MSDSIDLNQFGTQLSVILEGDNSMADLVSEMIGEGLGKTFRVAVLDGGMTSGRPAVCIATRITIKDPDGDGEPISVVVVGQTSMRNFVTAARMMEAKFPSMFDPEGD